MKKLKKQTMGHVKIGMLSGVGAMGIGAVGGSTTGLTTMSGFMPTVANVQGAGGVMRQMDSLNPNKKKKKRRK